MAIIIVRMRNRMFFLRPWLSPYPLDYVGFILSTILATGGRQNDHQPHGAIDAPEVHHRPKPAMREPRSWGFQVGERVSGHGSGSIATDPSSRLIPTPHRLDV